jgi:hypothetical protein
MATNKDSTKTGKSMLRNPALAKASTIRRQVGMGSKENALATKPMNALATTYSEAIVQAKAKFAEGFQALTCAVAMKDLTPPQLSEVHDYTAATLDAITEAKTLIRGRVLAYALTNGAPVGDSGLSREVVLPGGLVQRVTISKSGTDPKKFEAALRAKGAPMDRFMDQVVSWKMKEGQGSQDLALAEGIFTKDELDALAYEPSYRVDRTKEKKGES